MMSKYLFSALVIISTFNLEAKNIRFEQVNDVDFVADFHSSENKNKFGVLVVGGSGGGKPKQT